VTSQHFDADVAIIGYGPTGVSAANFLGSQGLKVIAFERDKDIYQRARAVTVNDWTLRCFQSVGLDQALLKDMDPHTSYRWKTYAGKVLRTVKVEPSTMGQPPAMAIYQPVMEQTLRDGAARFADRVEVRFGQTVTAVDQHEAGATVATADGQKVRVRYVLACDGGSSATREHLGISLLGDTIETRWVVIDARVKRWWPERHILTFWSDAKRPVVDIALGLGNHRWEFPLGPNESESDFATKEQLWTLLGSMGVTPDDVEIHQHAFYKHHVRKAERWRDGRVFLLGDAAHLMPPWAGQGMQSGIRDAFNLSWKIALVVKGTVTGAEAQRLLNSYQAERAPDVAFMTGVTEQLGRIIKMQMTAKEKALAGASALLARIGIPIPTLPVALPPALVAGWMTGKRTKQAALGKMPPQPMMSTATGRYGRMDDLIGPGFVLLGDNCDPAELLDAEQRAAWDRLGASYVPVRTASKGSETQSDLIDLDGTMIDWMRAHRTKAIALRPDRFVAADHLTGLGPPCHPNH
jgi:3-(3-hydroxy-phenyl)propionate hydroxylase